MGASNTGPGAGLTAADHNVSLVLDLLGAHDQGRLLNGKGEHPAYELPISAGRKAEDALIALGWAERTFLDPVLRITPTGRRALAETQDQGGRPS